MGINNFNELIIIAEFETYIKYRLMNSIETDTYDKITNSIYCGEIFHFRENLLNLTREILIQ